MEGRHWRCTGQSPCHGCPLVGPRHWSSSEPPPRPYLRDLMAAAGSMGHSPWDLDLIWAAWGEAESWAPGSLSDDGWAGSGRLALRAEICLFRRVWALVGGPRLGVGPMVQGRVTGWCWKPLLLARAWTSESLGTLPFLVRTENNICFGGSFQKHHDLTVTWLQKQRIWHQEVCNH